MSPQTAAYIADLQTRRSNVSARLAALAYGSPGDKPDAISAAGTNLQHKAYKDGLIAELAQYDKLIADAIASDAVIDAASNGPFEIVS